MANNLRVFNTNSEYQSADLILPSVSYVVETDKVIYDYTPPTPPVFQGKWNATYSNGNVTSAECGSSSEIVMDEINLTKLVSVEIGDCVTDIGDSAFIGCSSLTNIVIPDSVTSIGDSAFDSCTNLTSINIPSGVTSIDNNAFRNCSGLASITIEAITPPTLGGWSIFVGTNNCPIYVPSGSVNAYKTARIWFDYASRIYPIP